VKVVMSEDVHGSAFLVLLYCYSYWLICPQNHMSHNSVRIYLLFCISDS